MPIWGGGVHCLDYILVYDWLVLVGWEFLCTWQWFVVDALIHFVKSEFFCYLSKVSTKGFSFVTCRDKSTRLDNMVNNIFIFLVYIIKVNCELIYFIEHFNWFSLIG